MDPDRERLWRNTRDARDYTTTDEDSQESDDSTGGNPGERGNANDGGMEGIAQILARLTDAITVGNRNNEVLMTMLHEQQQARVQEAERQNEFRARQRRVKLDASTFPPYEDKGTEAQKMAAFVAWEQGVRNALVALEAEDRGMPINTISAAILASFRDKALEKATTLH